MNRSIGWVLLLGGVVASSPLQAAEETYGPGDPIAAIDGDPIFLGELNLILHDRLKIRDLDAVDVAVKRATAALLVRRHLALKSLQQQGGPALQAIIDRQIESIAEEAKRRGSSLEQQAESRLADRKSLEADIRWRTAWREYLKSQLNEVNLRRFFELEKSRYAGGRWKVSQIFLKIDPHDQASLENATGEMASLAEQLKASPSLATDFARAAEQYSEAGSAAAGGSLGWVEQDGDLPAVVMEAIRDTSAGNISGPVQSPLGLHLVLVQDVEAGQLSFDQLSDHSQLRRDAADALFETLVRRQADAKIVWFIPALKPPPGVSLIPD